MYPWQNTVGKMICASWKYVSSHDDCFHVKWFPFLPSEIMIKKLLVHSWNLSMLEASHPFLIITNSIFHHVSHYVELKTLVHIMCKNPWNICYTQKTLAAAAVFGYSTMSHLFRCEFARLFTVCLLCGRVVGRTRWYLSLKYISKYYKILEYISNINVFQMQGVFIYPSYIISSKKIITDILCISSVTNTTKSFKERPKKEKLCG